MTVCSYSVEYSPELGRRVMRLRCETPDPEHTTEAAFVPEIGSNLFSLKVGGTEFLHAFGSQQPRRLLGTPILYPTPNRVRGARFTFEGQTFSFTPNNGPNYIHGLVREAPWVCGEPEVVGDAVRVRTHVRMAPGDPLYERFPIRNTLDLVYTLTAGAIRFDFCGSTTDPARRLPFGLAIHPYFPILGPRDTVRLQVPALKWMEAIDLWPTGRLVDLELGPADLREPTSLRDLDLDDVFWGLESGKAQVISYDRLGKKVTLRAADFFTHSVVYTPRGQPFFCVENQSCSTDAHNLHSQGLTDEAHLTVLEPGDALQTWIEIQISDI